MPLIGRLPTMHAQCVIFHSFPVYTMAAEIANLLNLNAKDTSNLGDLLVDFFRISSENRRTGESWEEDINDTDVNDNDFLSEPEEEFDPRQTDFEISHEI